MCQIGLNITELPLDWDSIAQFQNNETSFMFQCFVNIAA
jgi:hypothetical protein